MTDQKPWRLEDLVFESMGDDLRERATIDGVEIVRQDGRYWINSPYAQWSNLMIGRSTPLLIFCSTSGGAGSDALMPLKLRPTGLGAGIDKDRQDYTVFCGEWAIGRIYETRGGPDHLRWFRSMTVDPMRSGRVATLEEAKAQLRKSWDAWKAWAHHPTAGPVAGSICSRREESEAFA